MAVRVGTPVWHVVTGENCIGIVKELRDAGYGYGGGQGSTDAVRLGWYARVHWLPGCEADSCAGNTEDDEDEWFKLEYLRQIGEPE